MYIAYMYVHISCVTINDFGLILALLFLLAPEYVADGPGVDGGVGRAGAAAGGRQVAGVRG